MANVGLYMVMVFALLTLGANAAATYIICRTYFEMKNRRRNQVIFVWLVPLIGALLAILINREEYVLPKTSKTGGKRSKYYRIAGGVFWGRRQQPWRTIVLTTTCSRT